MKKIIVHKKAVGKTTTEKGTDEPYLLINPLWKEIKWSGCKICLQFPSGLWVLWAVCILPSIATVIVFRRWTKLVSIRASWSYLDKLQYCIPQSLYQVPVVSNCFHQGSVGNWCKTVYGYDAHLHKTQNTGTRWSTQNSHHRLWAKDIIAHP